MYCRDGVGSFAARESHVVERKHTILGQTAVQLAQHLLSEQVSGLRSPGETVVDNDVIALVEVLDLIPCIADQESACRLKRKELQCGVGHRRVNFDRIGHDPLRPEIPGDVSAAEPDQQCVCGIRTEQGQQPQYLLVAENAPIQVFVDRADDRGIGEHQSVAAPLIVHHPHPAVETFRFGPDRKPFHRFGRRG